jgi:RNA polymerase subunit RPABC4/transcription elongation factor Spt4
MGAIPIILQVLIAFFGAYFIALWFSMIIWTYYDIRARSQDLYVHIFATALVVVFNVFGLVLYLILRPRETLAEAYERSLEEETLLQEIEERQACPSCRHRVQPDFLLCPYCHTELKQRCPRCERLLLLRWDICPFCGNTQLPAMESPAEPAPRASVTAAPPAPAIARR